MVTVGLSRDSEAECHNPFLNSYIHSLVNLNHHLFHLLKLDKEEQEETEEEGEGPAPEGGLEDV